MNVDKKNKIRKFTFRGKDLSEILSLPQKAQIELFNSRIRRKFRRLGENGQKFDKLVQKIINSKLNLQPGEKPSPIKTHYRNCVILPQMVGGMVGVYNGKEYKEFEIKFDMIGTYLGEYSITYKPTLRKAAFAKADAKGVADKGKK